MVILLMRDSVEIEPTYRDLIKELKEKKIRVSINGQIWII
jgi:hypothetical protein